MNLLNALFNNVLVVTPIIVLLLLFTPLLDKRYAAVGRYWLWLLVMGALCFPFTALIKQPTVQIDVHVTEVLDTRSSMVNAVGRHTLPKQETIVYEGYEGATYSLPSQAETVSFQLPDFSFSGLLLMVWLVGSITSLLVYGSSHLSLLRFTRRWRTTVTATEITAELEKQRFIMDIDKNIELWYCKGIKAPMLMGLVKPMLYLPDSFQNTDDMSLVFRHELTHYKRHDLWYKLALMIVKSIFWFNPVIHMMAKQANKDIETVCDTLTVNGMDMEQRKRYSEIILGMAGGAFYRSQLATHFGGGKNMLKQRFSNILGNNKKNGTAVFVMLGVFIFASGIMIGFKFAPNTTFALDTIEQETYEVNTEPSAANVQTKLEYEADSLGDLFEEMFSEKWKNELSAALKSNVSDYVMELSELESITKVIKDNYWASTNNIKPYNSMDELKKLVFDEAKLIETQYDNVSSLNISTSYDNISVKQGGDKLVIKYYQWLENGYSVIFEKGELTLSNNDMPYLLKGGSYTNGWLKDYLKEQGKQLVNTVEITIPKKMSLDKVILSTASGSVNVVDSIATNLYVDTASGDATIEHFNANLLNVDTASGDANVKSCVLERLTIDTASGRADVRSCDVGSLIIGTASGNSNVEASKLDKLSIDTASGNGYIRLVDKADNYDIAFDTNSGQLTYNGKKVGSMRNQNASGKISLDSTSGSFIIEDNN